MAENLLVEIPHQIEFLKKYNHAYCVRLFMGNNDYWKAYNASTITLNDLCGMYTPNAPIRLIETWLCQYSFFMRLPLEDDQVNETALYLYDFFKPLNMAELTLFFKKAKMGSFGKMYGDIDPSELLRWAKQFKLERGKTIATHL
ncbi:hypothetical protein [Maribellus sp. YY47]|uniref:hypothetical protein n=1 Tax=Maribellus sp. YY47 TaxID=2929486 RepID=UPI002000B97B|nr:hypothetical protein [Maribellus sp. YY47]MCK3682799.1 hypothetical protein [Maribellus sp. YY47]